jgi:hypothetical protein
MPAWFECVQLQEYCLRETIENGVSTMSVMREGALLI